MALSGLIHLAIITGHSLHAPAHALFFAVLGVFQIGWAVAYGVLPRRWLRWAGLVLSGGMIVLWALTRSLPAPFSGLPEEVDAAGVISKILETIALVSLILEEAWEHPPIGRQIRLILAGLMAAVISGLGIYASALAIEPTAPPSLAPQDDQVAAEPSSPGHGHAGTRRIQLDDVPAGPYLVRAVTAFGADPLRGLGLEVRVIDASSRKTLTGAAVRIIAESEVTADRVEAIAVQGEATIPRDYGAWLDFPVPGPWRVAILVDGPLGRAQTGFELPVPSGGGVGQWLGAYLPFGGLLLLIVAYLLLARTRPSGEATSD